MHLGCYEMRDARIPTGIKGFDVLIGGGFIPNTNVLVSGGPGTGKTVFALQTAYNLAKSGEAVYYLSFEQNLQEIILQAKEFGWNIRPLIDSKKFVFRNIPASVVDIDLSGIISKDVKRYKPTLVVIDSVSKLGAIADSMRIALDPTEFEKIAGETDLSATHFITGAQLKKFVYLLLERFKKYGTTNIVITDAPTNDGMTVEGASEFAADSLLLFNYIEIGVADYRTMSIRKMRGSDHYKQLIPFDILSNKGIVVREKELRRKA